MSNEIDTIHILNAAFAAVEQKLIQEINSLKQQGRDLVQQLQVEQQKRQAVELEREQREQALNDQMSQSRMELEVLQRTMQERERDVAEQILTIQRQAARDIAEQTRSHTEQERMLQGTHAEREQSILSQLLAGQQELRSVMRDQLQREKEMAALLSQADQKYHQELEDLLRTLAVREKEFGEQTLIARQAYEQEKTELLSKYDVQEKMLQSMIEQNRGYAERERELNQQLQFAQQAFLGREKEWSGREEALSSLVTQVNQKHRQELENLLRTLAVREKEFGEQTLVARQAYEQEKAELLSNSDGQKKMLQQEFAVQEEALRAEARFYLQQLVERERAFDDQMAQIQEVAQQKLETVRMEAQQKLEIAQATAQSFLQQLAARERVLGEQLTQVQHEAVERAQELNSALLSQHHTSKALQLQVTELDHALRVARNQEATLRVDLARQSEHSMAVETEIALMRQELSWRVTAPLRRFRDWLANYRLRLSNEQSGSQAGTTNSPVVQQGNEHTVTTIRHINQLLELPNAAFLEAAYQTLLGRMPDPEGKSYYLGRLRAGYGKAMVITQIAESAEAKNRGVELTGLSELVAAQQKARHWFWRMFTRGNRTEPQACRLESELSCVIRQEPQAQTLALQAALPKMPAQESLITILMPRARDIYRDLKADNCAKGMIY